MRFTIQLASMDIMPLAVTNFLRQVRKGLWDGTSFYLNAEHVLMARPVSWDSSHSRRREFGDLKHVPYGEYSDEFPHVAYTLGLNGHPAGPDFYINKVDNTIPHGPKGHQKSGEAEPCFAKIIIGRSTIDAIAQQPGKDDEPALLFRAVEIVSVRVLGSLMEAKGGPSYIAAENAKQQHRQRMEARARR